MKIPAIAIHGGSGTIASNTKAPEPEKQYLKALCGKYRRGHQHVKIDVVAGKTKTG